MKTVSTNKQISFSPHNTDVVDFEQDLNAFFTIKEAAEWASIYLHRPISIANISYLINYGKIKKYIHNNTVVIIKNELKEYYKTYREKRQAEWMHKLGKGNYKTCTQITSLQR